MIKSTKNKGFHMTFKNGITISVQFGYTNYCSRKSEYPFDSSKLEEQDEMRQHIIESETAEVAIWDKEGKWFKFETDTVKGWVDANTVAQWINIASSAHDMKHLTELAIMNELMEDQGPEFDSAGFTYDDNFEDGDRGY